MFDIEKIEINAAFYELFENVFGEDFFSVLAKMRPSARITNLRLKKVEELDESEQAEVMDFNLKLGIMMKKYSPRVAYIGSLLYKKQYNGSYNGYMDFLASCDSAAFLDAETIKVIWEKINLDQNLPKSVKNA